MPMASRLEVLVEVRDCAKFVKVVIEKVDDRNAERIMGTEMQDRFVIKSPPSPRSVSRRRRKRRWRNSEIFILDFHGTVGGTFNML